MDHPPANWAPFLQRAERFMDRVEAALRLDIEQPDWGSAIAFRYRKRVSGQGYIAPVQHVGAMALADLKEIDIQKEKSAATPSSLCWATAPTMCCSPARAARVNPRWCAPA